MHLAEMRIKYSNHVTLKTVAEKCIECGLAMKTLLEWGSNIKNKFLVDNVKAAIEEGGSLIPIMLERIVALEKIVRSQQEVSCIRSRFHFVLPLLNNAIDASYNDADYIGHVNECANHAWTAQ
jgi:hypothetical protein